MRRMGSMENEEYAVEVISKGEFIDDGGYHGKWRIETATVRINNALWSAWYNKITPEQLCIERCILPEELTRGRWEALDKEADERNEKHEESMKRTIANLAGFEGASNVQQVVSEIFAIVRMTELCNGKE